MNTLPIAIVGAVLLVAVGTAVKFMLKHKLDNIDGLGGIAVRDLTKDNGMVIAALGDSGMR